MKVRTVRRSGGEPVNEIEKAKRWVRLKKAYALANELEFTDDERHELAGMVVGVDDTSWSKLTIVQLHDLITMMEGYIWISYMVGLRKYSDES
jgi:hypothetical protein